MTLCNQKCSHELIKKNGSEIRNTKCLPSDDLQCAFTLCLNGSSGQLFEANRVFYFWFFFFNSHLQMRKLKLNEWFLIIFKTLNLWRNC